MKILVIRRDNIGDLVCTTPLFSSLRTAFPHAYIAALVNSYSAPVIVNNPSLTEVFLYHKSKHTAGIRASLNNWAEALGLLLKLRSCQFDIVIAIGNSSLKFARMLSAKRIISAGHQSDDNTIPISELEPLHAAEAAHHYLTRLGIQSPPGKLVVIPDRRWTPTPPPCMTSENTIRIGLQLSARKPSQRWSVDHFAALAEKLHREIGAEFLVFWSPGTSSNRMHPGDDEKAQLLKSQVRDIPFWFCETSRLEELIAAMDIPDIIVSSDGGAMHIAAGLGKPVVALFGDSPTHRWSPWQVPSRILSPASKKVSDVSVKEVFAAVLELVATIRPDSTR